MPSKGKGKDKRVTVSPAEWLPPNHANALRPHFTAMNLSMGSVNAPSDIAKGMDFAEAFLLEFDSRSKEIRECATAFKETAEEKGYLPLEGFNAE